jgi:hypothetical protein
VPGAPDSKPAGTDDQVVQDLEVLVVPRQDSPPVRDGVRKVDLVTAAGQSGVGRDLDVMSVAAQQSEEDSAGGQAAMNPLPHPAGTSR